MGGRAKPDQSGEWDLITSAEKCDEQCEERHKCAVEADNQSVAACGPMKKHRCVGSSVLSISKCSCSTGVSAN